MPPQRKPMMERTPGQIYKGITFGGEKFEAAQTERLIERDPQYVQFCKNMRKRYPSYARNASFPDAQREAIQFLGWRMNAGDFSAAIKGTFMTGLIPIIIILVMVFILGLGIEFGEFTTREFLGEPFLNDLTGGDEAMAFSFFIGIALMLFGLLGGIIYYIYNFPLSAAKAERNRALSYVPEIVGYMIMSMKLVPNLEKAIEFSAKHGRGKVANEFKKILWDFQIGVYGSVSEGIDALAYRWGKSELKEALMRIRSSVLEPSESRRVQVLDKAMSIVLESVKEKMEDYARSLNQPATMLFYLGVLLPLLLVIILPVGSAFSGMPFARPELLFILYCVLIPAIAFMFAKKVVDNRPDTYEPPQISDNYFSLAPKWMMKLGGMVIDARLVFVIIIVFGTGLSLYTSMEGFPPKSLMPADDGGYTFQFIPADKSVAQINEAQGRAENYFYEPILDIYILDIPDIRKGKLYNDTLKTISVARNGVVSEEDEVRAENIVFLAMLKETSEYSTDPTKYVFWSGFIITLVCAISFLLYYRNIYKRKVQLEIISMEDEFKESMYIIASRMGENKPVENALKHARDFLSDMAISKRIFAKTIDNIELMGMSIDNAVFDPVYGSMKNIPSKILVTSMQLLVDSVTLGVEVASRTLMSLSLQMENMDKVNKGLKVMVSEVSTTMRTMAVFIAPIVLGITTVLQKVVMNTLAGIVSEESIQAVSSGAGDVGALAGGAGGSFNVNSMFSTVTADVFRTFVTPLGFFVIISIYVVEIVVIMIYFTTKIEEDNDLLFKINLAFALPIAVTIFVVTVFVGNIAVSAIM